MNTAIEIILFVILAVVTAILAYFQTKGNILAAVGAFIESIEGSGLVGKQKMDKVVDQLYEKVPGFLKKIFTKEKLREIAQDAFNTIDKYADKIVEAGAKTNTIEEQVEAAKGIGVEAAAETLSGLLDLTLGALTEKANELGINVKSGMTRKAIAEEIAKAVIKKA